jgi:hypothetical protein
VSIDTLPDTEGTDVELSAGAGLGYQYRWDFDSDGTLDTEWSNDPKAAHSYGTSELQPGLIAVIEPAGYDATLRESRVAEGERLWLAEAELGQNWQNPDSDGQPPRFFATPEGLSVEPMGARVRFDGKDVAADEKVLVQQGQHVDVGYARITVAAEAKPTLRVRNAFGVERECSIGIVLPRVVERLEVEVLSMRGKP